MCICVIIMMHDLDFKVHIIMIKYYMYFYHIEKNAPQFKLCSSHATNKYTFKMMNVEEIVLQQNSCYCSILCF